MKEIDINQYPGHLATSVDTVNKTIRAINAAVGSVVGDLDVIISAGASILNELHVLDADWFHEGRLHVVVTSHRDAFGLLSRANDTLRARYLGLTLPDDGSITISWAEFNEDKVPYPMFTLRGKRADKLCSDYLAAKRVLDRYKGINDSLENWMLTGTRKAYGAEQHKGRLNRPQPKVPVNKLVILQSRPGTWRDVHWNVTPELKDILDSGFIIVDPTVAKLVEELDRRFVQLWDKVSHERKRDELKASENNYTLSVDISNYSAHKTDDLIEALTLCTKHI